MADLFKNFIDGKWVESKSGDRFERRNPATGELVGVFTRSGPADVDAAVAAANKAFKSWRLYPAPKRGEILYRAAQILLDRKEQLAREMTEEMGKVISEARGDVQEAIDMTFYMAGEGRRMYGQTTPSELREKFNMSVRKPFGVCGVITPWNFPMAIPSWKMMPALISGNLLDGPDRRAHPHLDHAGVNDPVHHTWHELQSRSIGYLESITLETLVERAHSAQPTPNYSI